MTGRTGLVVCMEGPSAVGKTSLGSTLARTLGTTLVEEVTGAAPPGAAPTSWFVSAHVKRWARAVDQAERAGAAVLDGDPFKALWYDHVYATDPAASITAAAESYAAEVARGALGWPDLYVALDASKEQLRTRRAGDATRRRRNHDRHMRLIEPMRRYFAELSAVLPGRVIRLDTTDRDALLPQIERALAVFAPTRPEPLAVLNHLVGRLLVELPDDGEMRRVDGHGSTRY